MSQEEVVIYPEFPQEKQVAQAGPSIDEIRRRTIKSMVSGAKRPYMNKKQIMDRIEEATVRGEQEVQIPKEEVRSKDLIHYAELGYKIRDQKKNTGGCCLGLSGGGTIRITWK